jgi:hypothetical protein
MQISTPQTRSLKTNWTHTGAGNCTCGDVHDHQPVDSFVPSEPGRRPAETPQALADEARRTELGQTLWQRYLDGQIDLLPVQVSGRNDGADARANIADTALGRSSKRSSYGNAPGGRVSLTFSLLEGLKSLSDDFSFRVTAMAGGSHSSRSRHYLGVALDVDTIDGSRVNKDHPRFREFMTKARALGATEVLGPGSRGHDTHLHIAWPRNAKV